MSRGISLMAVAVVVFALPAFAQDRCGPSPSAPVVPNGNTASLAELNAAATDIKAFVKTSDDWQHCLKADLDTQKDAAKGSRTPFDPKVEVAINAKGAANQRDKDRVGKEYQSAAAAWNSAHPR